jgi:DNA helicase-2/ATP-dependent DNA helicase PcrA
LGYFLGQLEPVAQDLATQSDSVKIMSITSSKGITVNTCIVMGVESGIIPHPKGQEEEERRLLYVAMTRATEMSILTFAHKRKGQTARHGIANVNRLRGRSPLLETLPIGQYRDGQETIKELLE